MSAYRQKPVVVDAVRWFANGNHPLDYEKSGEEFSAAERRERNFEGDVVRYYRHPDLPGGILHRTCGTSWHEHGWIDTPGGGHVVCPGDWVVQGVTGEFYPCKPDVFAATYESVASAGTPDMLSVLKDGR